MEIDIQTILQQDIDLGIRPTPATATPLDFGYYPDQNLSKQIEFYKETQKNADIIATTGLFEQSCIPENCKLVLEEDTGEHFLILVTNETNKSADYAPVQAKETVFANLTVSNQTDPKFLSQASINQELDKLNANFTFNATNLEETLANLDSDNLLDESWINQLLVESEHQSEPVYDQIKIHDDKMLSTLNENQTFVLSPPLVQSNYLINDTIYNDTAQFESMLDQAIMAHEKELSHKNDSFMSGKQLEEIDLSNLLSYADDTSKLNQVNTTMKVLSLSNGYLASGALLSSKSSDDNDVAKKKSEQQKHSAFDIELKVRSKKNFLYVHYIIL
jgi:hypothetical protein